ncbi:gamma-butyrobetaine dioxygenase-like [Paramuricea clavata]|nr:gamma-butyrobetaine dioxygenase-like [Paramuricea clavata]
MFSKFPKSLLWRSGIKVLRRATPAGFSKEASSSFIKDDITASAPKPLIQNVSKGDEKRYLKIAWNDGTSSRFPYIFLRDNCRCPECFDNASKQHILHTVADIGLDIEVKKASLSKDGLTLKCLWPNGHESMYTQDWLRDTRMREGNETRPRNFDSLIKDELILWDRAKLQDKVPSHDYSGLMKDDKNLFDFLYALYQHGLVLVNHAPAKDGVIMEMAARIGWNRRTHLGEYWDVKIEDDPTHLGSTAKFLHFHTDLPYYSTTPTIQALHCIQQSSEGGRSTFVDGFNVVKQLKRINPDAFDVLTDFYVRYSDEGNDAFGEYSLGFSAPIIKLNKFGRVEHFQCSHFVMSETQNDYSPSEVLAFYDAYYQLTKLLYKSENVVDFRLQPGQVALFQNTRVMHGRSAYEVIGETSVSAARWLQGTFFEHDVIFSKLRVLQQKLGLKSPRIYKQSDDFF